MPIHPHVFFDCGGRFSKEEETARLRDEFVFGDDLDKMYNEDRIRLDGDEAYKRALGSKPNAVSTPADQRIDDGAPVGDSQSPIKKIEF